VSNHERVVRLSSSRAGSRLPRWRAQRGFCRHYGLSGRGAGGVDGSCGCRWGACYTRLIGGTGQTVAERGRERGQDLGGLDGVGVSGHTAGPRCGPLAGARARW
jgi:hypothetical protein